MAYKFEIDGLYLKVTDTATNDILINEVRDQIKWKLTSDGDYCILYKTAVPSTESANEFMFLISNASYSFSDIVDSGGSAFASESVFRSWLSQYIGFLDSALLTSTYTNSSSGLYSGGGVTINGLDNTKIDIDAGSAIWVDYWSVPGTVTHYNFSWDAQSALTVDNLLTSTQSYIAIDYTGTIQQFATRPTDAERRGIIVLAQLGHASMTTVASVNDYTSFWDSPIESWRDLVWEFKLISTGNLISANGANLNINKSAGFLFGMGINYQNDPLTPNRKTISSATGASFRYRTQTGGSTSPVTAIDPTKYDNGGTISNVPAVSTNATNQRVYLFPNGNLVIQYGQTVYSSLAEAIASSQFETFTEFTNVSEGAILIGIISVTRGCTALNNTAQARFLRVSKFGETVGGASGISTTNLQNAYDNSTTPEIVTDATRGALSIKRGSGADTDDVIEFLNGAGTKNAYVKGNGNAGFAQLTINGAFTLPTVDGSANQVLQTNGAGVASWATIPSGLTVGTTAISSGTNNRILFQSGGVLQQSGNLQFNGTQLDIYAGLNVQVSSGLYLGIGAISSINRFTPYSTGTPTRFLDSTNLYGNLGVGALSVGGVGYADTVAPTNGAIFQGNVSIGATTAGAKLDVKAQGALSSDLAFRVRNSGNTANIFEIAGNATALMTGTSGNIFRSTGTSGNCFRGDATTGTGGYFSNTNGISGQSALRVDGAITVNTDQAGGLLRMQGASDDVEAIRITQSNGATIGIRAYTNGNFSLGNGIGNGTNSLGLISGTSPTASLTDGVLVYSKDQTAGNACLHTRTENGSIIKLYQETTGVGASTLVGGGGTTLTDTDTFDGYTLKQIVKALRNQGLLA